MIQRRDWVIRDLADAEIEQILQNILLRGNWTEEMMNCTYTGGGGGWREGWSLEAGSQSLGSAPGCRPAPGKAEKALGNCMALRKGLGGAGASLSGISLAQMIIITVSWVWRVWAQLGTVYLAVVSPPVPVLSTNTQYQHQHSQDVLSRSHFITGHYAPLFYLSLNMCH